MNSLTVCKTLNTSTCIWTAQYTTPRHVEYTRLIRQVNEFANYTQLLFLPSSQQCTAPDGPGTAIYAICFSPNTAASNLCLSLPTFVLH